MKKRIDFNVVQPAAYDAMDALDQYVNGASLDKAHKELIRIRASQLNGCAYCVDMHSADALKMGISLQKIFLVSAWKEAGAIFTEEERLLFQLTEEITLISEQGLSEAAYESSIALFGAQKTAEIIMTVATVNAWNRIGVATHLQPSLKKIIP